MVNKKASLEEGVMVVMTLLLFVYILFAIYSQSSKVSENFNAVSNIYSEKQGYENTIYLKLSEDFLTSYQKVLSENILGSSSVDLNKVFEEDLRDRFKQVDGSDELKRLFGSINSFSFDGNKSYTGFPSLVAERNYSNFNITYSSGLNVSTGFDNFGLPSFDKIETVYSSCTKFTSKSEIENCFKMGFPAFIVEIKSADAAISNSAPSLNYISGSDSSSVINSVQVVSSGVGDVLFGETNVFLTSQNQYYLNKEMQNIRFVLSFYYKSS